MDTEKRVVEGVVIPPGYEAVHTLEEALNPTIKDSVRWLNRNVAFVFDPGNAEYLEFLERCRVDSRSLAKALDQELKERGVPVWLKAEDKMPRSKTHFRKMSFLIRPPFFSSNQAKSHENRMQKDSDRSNFILHFDEDHTLQIVRFWKPDAVEGESESRRVYKTLGIRLGITMALENEKEFFKENYGKWEVIAKKVADILEDIMTQVGEMA
jgi:hypothetical protein